MWDIDIAKHSMDSNWVWVWVWVCGSEGRGDRKRWCGVACVGHGHCAYTGRLRWGPLPKPRPVVKAAQDKTERETETERGMHERV